MILRRCTRGTVRGSGGSRPPVAGVESGRRAADVGMGASSNFHKWIGGRDLTWQTS